MVTHKWPLGLPAKRTRVVLLCGSQQATAPIGVVVEDGPEVCLVRWDHGLTQYHPIAQLMPEKKASI
jgi:hypothetical protein